MNVDLLIMALRLANKLSDFQGKASELKRLRKPLLWLPNTLNQQRK